MQNISFTSRIRPVSMDEFRQAVKGMQNKFVDYPWTIRESVLADKAYTTGILDCTACGISDNQQVLLMHICPTNKANKKFLPISQFIEDKIDLKNPYIQGFILGSKSFYEDSTKLFDNFIDFMKQHEIPFSMFKSGGPENAVAYSSVKDEWLIGNCLITDNMKKEFPKSPTYVLKQLFEKCRISDLDEVSW